MKKLLYIFLLLLGVTTANAQYKGDGYDGFDAGSTNFFLPVYVKFDAVGANNGMNWTDAYTTLTNALTNSLSQEIWVAAGTYTGGAASPCPMYLDNNALYGGFVGTETNRIQRNWNANLTYIEGLVSTNAQVSIFKKTQAGQAVVDGFIIRNAKDQTLASGGGVFNVTAGNLWIENVVAYSNYSTGAGGFLYSTASGVTNTILNCNISTNWASGNGGALYTSAGWTLITNTVFDSNQSTNNGYGGAFYATGVQTNTIIGCSFITNSVTNNARSGGAIYKATAGGLLQIYNSGFTNNWAGFSGGVLYSQDNALQITNSSFVGNNSTNDGGGAIYHTRGGATNTFNNCYFASNFTTIASGHGGAVYISVASTNTFNSCSFVTNYASANNSAGGCIYENSAGGLLQIYNSGFTNNWAGSSGGIVYSQDASLQITNSSFVGNNSTNNSGGAIYHTRTGATNTFNNCYFASNVVSANGGAILINNPSTNIFNSCSFVTNYTLVASGSGSCIFEVAAGGLLQLYNSGFTNNSSGAGGAIVSQDASLQITNCSFAGNTATNGTGGAIYHQRAGATNFFNNCYFSNNFTTIASANGGAILINNASTNTFNSCSFVTNYVSGANAIGGCIYENGAAGLLQIYNCGFTNNWSSGQAGVLGSQANSLQITNSSFVGNTSTNNQAGVITHNRAGATNFFNNCYFASNFITKSGVNGGVIYITSASTNTFNSCSFVTNYASANNSVGGCLYEQNAGGLLQIYNSGFTNNWSGGSAGVLYSQDNALQITNSSFVGNNSTNSNSGVIQHSRAGATNTFNNCYFASNFTTAANGHGGVFYFVGVVTNTFSSCSFVTNSARAISSIGGCIMEGNVGGRLLINNCGFTNNWSGAQGGVIWSYDYFLTVTNSIFYGNGSTNSHGGAIYQNQSGAVNVYTNTVFLENFASGPVNSHGGAIYIASSGTTSFYYNCSFITNRTQGANYGGAIYNYGEQNLYDCGFTNNVTHYNGAAIYDNGLTRATRCSFVANACTNRNGAVTLSGAGKLSAFTNCAFIANSSAGTASEGGGAVLFGASNPTGIFNNCTFFTNIDLYASGGGGAICLRGANSQIFVTNCIFRGDVGNTAPEIWMQNSGSTVFIGYSCIDTTKIAGGGTKTVDGGMLNVDPLFASETVPYDVHEKSKGGRWNGSTWVIDTVQSPCIDYGYMFSPFSLEPQPNGYRINMGAYGNTTEASKSDWGNYQSVPNIFNDIYLPNDIDGQ